MYLRIRRLILIRVFKRRRRIVVDVVVDNDINNIDLYVIIR